MKKLKKGIIIGVYDRGSIWTIDVAEKFERGKPKGKVYQIHGDWRPIRDSLDSAFDISSSEFPYVSNKKIYENVIGQEIEFEPEMFGGWRPTGRKAFDLKVDETGKIRMLKSKKRLKEMM